MWNNEQSTIKTYMHNREGLKKTDSHCDMNLTNNLVIVFSLKELHTYRHSSMSCILPGNFNMNIPKIKHYMQNFEFNQFDDMY